MIRKINDKLNIAMLGQKKIPLREGGVEMVVEELSAQTDGWEIIEPLAITAVGIMLVVRNMME